MDAIRHAIGNALIGIAVHATRDGADEMIAPARLTGSVRCRVPAPTYRFRGGRPRAFTPPRRDRAMRESCASMM
jgi:hypothetical protein